MEKTTSYEELNREVIGYMLNVPLGKENQSIVRSLQQRFENKFGELIWSLPTESLHITLMDWIAPLVDYGKDKDGMFRSIFEEYDTSLTGILALISPIDARFSQIHVSTGGVYLTATDNGQFEQIRTQFLQQVDLIPDTKQPPKIIHTTIARFAKSVDIEPIKTFASELNTSFVQPIDSFLLVGETKIPMLERETVKEYRF